MLFNILLGLCVCLSNVVWAEGDSCPVNQQSMRIAMNTPKSSSSAVLSSTQDNADLLSNMTVLVIHRATCPHCMHLMKDVFTSFSQSSARYGIKTQPKIQPKTQPKPQPKTQPKIEPKPPVEDRKVAAPAPKDDGNNYKCITEFVAEGYAPLFYFHLFNFSRLLTSDRTLQGG